MKDSQRRRIARLETRSAPCWGCEEQDHLDAEEDRYDDWAIPRLIRSLHETAQQHQVEAGHPEAGNHDAVVSGLGIVTTNSREEAEATAELGTEADEGPPAAVPFAKPRNGRRRSCARCLRRAETRALIANLADNIPHPEDGAFAD